MAGEIITLNAEIAPPIYGLPEAVQKVIMEVARKRSVPVDYVLGPLLATASTAIGSRVVVDGLKYKNRLNLWVMVVASSGSNKSYTAKDIIRPLEEIDYMLYEQYRNERAEIEAKRAAGNNDVPLPAPKQLIIKDTTPEARLDALQNNPHGLLNAREEMAATMGDLGRYGSSGEIGDMLSMYDCTSIKVNRKSDGMKTISHPYYSWICGIQPGILKSTFNSDRFLASGFLHRFTVFFSTEHPDRRYKKNVTFDPAVLNEWEKLIRDLYSNVHDCTIGVTDEAEAVYIRFNDKSIQLDETDCEYENSVWAKLRIQVIKFAGIAQVMKCISLGVPITAIDAESMSWAVDIAFYVYNCHMRMYSHICGTKPRQTEAIGKNTAIQNLFSVFGDTINISSLAKTLGVDPKQIRRWRDEPFTKPG